MKTGNKFVLLFLILAGMVKNSESGKKHSVDIPEGIEKEFKSENADEQQKLKVFVRRATKDDRGKCHQAIRFTYPNGPTQADVFVDCFKHLDTKNKGSEFWLGDVFYSDKTSQVFVIDNRGNCKKYWNENGTLKGPITLGDLECRKKKGKLGRLSIFGWIWLGITQVFHALNPFNWFH